MAGECDDDEDGDGQWWWQSEAGPIASPTQEWYMPSSASRT
jgi:hypothetical protein